MRARAQGGVTSNYARVRTVHVDHVISYLDRFYLLFARTITNKLRDSLVVVNLKRELTRLILGLSTGNNFVCMNS